MPLYQDAYSAFNIQGFGIYGLIPDFNGILRLEKTGLLCRNNEPTTAVSTLLKFEKPLQDAVFTIPNETGVAASKEKTQQFKFSCKALGSITSGAGAGVWKSIYKKKIPAGTISDLNQVIFYGEADALSTIQSKALGILINTVDDESTATEIASCGNWVAGAETMLIRRKYIQRGTNLRGITTNFSNPSDDSLSILQVTQNKKQNYACNPANDVWVYLAVKGNVSDTFQKLIFEMTITNHIP